MKTTLIVSAVLAASQCMPEPSDPAETTPSVQESADAGVRTPDASPTDQGAAAVETAKKLLEVGPAPFTVPTRRIEWPQQRATILVPQGARIDGDGDRARVSLGEGHNFAFHVAPAGRVIQIIPSADAEGVTQVPRDDGATMWFIDGHWFFSGTFGAFDCWNDAKSEHDRDEVEMMLASCKSIEQDTGE